GHWSLVIGHWSLVIGHWSLVISSPVNHLLSNLCKTKASSPSKNCGINDKSLAGHDIIGH
ncbi:MAG: hypothetical protein RM049_15785, partial [Nostoc sp. DedQUE04]|nr:hypothetical protein [Nostoc sp. DedQUE04]